MPGQVAPRSSVASMASRMGWELVKWLVIPAGMAFLGYALIGPRLAIVPGFEEQAAKVTKNLVGAAESATAGTKPVEGRPEPGKFEGVNINLDVKTDDPKYGFERRENRRSGN